MKKKYPNQKLSKFSFVVVNFVVILFFVVCLLVGWFIYLFVSSLIACFVPGYESRCVTLGQTEHSTLVLPKLMLKAIDFAELRASQDARVLLDHLQQAGVQSSCS